MKLTNKKLKELILKEYGQIDTGSYVPGYGTSDHTNKNRVIDDEGNKPEPIRLKRLLKTIMLELSVAIRKYAHKIGIGSEYLSRIGGGEKQRSALYNASIDLKRQLEYQVEEFVAQKGDRYSTKISERHYSQFLETEKGQKILEDAAKVFFTEHYKKSFGQKVGSFFGMGSSSKFEESMTLSSDDIRKMIQEEMGSLMHEMDYMSEDQSMGAMYQDLEERELFSYINMIKRDNPGISHDEAVEMAKEQMEADNMGMEANTYSKHEKAGHTMPVRESRKKKRKKNG